MELDDSFTEKLIQRTKARKEYIKERKNQSPTVNGKKRPALTEELQLPNQDVSNPQSKESPKRQCLYVPDSNSLEVESEKENVEMSDCSANSPVVPFHTNPKTRGLAALRKNASSNPVFSNDITLDQGLTSESQVNNCSTYIFSTNSKELCTTRQSRFANLAADIRQWEDDDYQPALSSKNYTSSLASKPSNKTSSSSSSNTFSMKLYYSNKPSVNNSAPVSCKSEKHGLENGFSDKGIKTSKSDGDGSRTLSTFNKMGNTESANGSVKQARLEAWDQAIMATLGEDPKTVATNVEYEQQCDSESEDDENCYNSDDKESHSNKGNNYTEDSKAKEIEIPKTEPSFSKDVDPAELPLSARKALFEKALLGGTPKQNENTFENKLSVAQRTALFENACKVNSGQKTSVNQRMPQRFIAAKSSPIKSKINLNAPISPAKNTVALQTKTVQSSPVKKFTASNAESPSKTTGSFHKSTVRTISHDSFEGSPVMTSSATIHLATSPNVGMHTRLVQQKLIESANNNWQQKDNVAKASEERKREISNLVNHWEKLSSASHSGNDVIECHEQADLNESVSYGSEECNESFENGEHLEYCEEFDAENESVCSNDTSAMEQDVFGSQSSLHSEDAKLLEQHTNDRCELSSEELSTNQQLLKATGRDNDVQQPQTNSLSTIPEDNLSVQSSTYCSESSSCNASGSLSCNSSTLISSCGTASSKINDGTPVQGSSNNNPDVPLLYTVSFYRKQKQETRSTPVRTIVRREKIPSPPSEDIDQSELIQERIKTLQEEILRQQTVISQTSQALNLCHSTTEFSGSTEQVEGERLLLIATQKRQACLNEIQRLKMHGAQGEDISDGTGTLTITDMQLPLKREFMAAQLEGKIGDTVHYFLCLIRHGAQVIVTQMVSTNDRVTDGALNFTNHIKLQSLPPDFSIVFEVYGLQTKKEVLPHEKKYHIKREHSKMRLTPKGKKSDGKLLLPAVSSPGGPNAVRSPSFGVIGFTRFTLHNCNKKCFTLDKVPYSSPLDGVLKVKLQLHAEHKVMHKGFLTMFEDVSGFGSWHRRWCALNAQNLVYWKYPDDEHRKEPIGSIDLRQCITNHIQSVARDICARPNTFQMMTVRPQEKGDKNTLISRTANTLTTTKHLLSADTKEERILWCNKLNEALASLRKWDPQALRPMESMQDK